MRKFLLFLILAFYQQFCFSKGKAAEDYYIIAFNEISDMLDGKDSLSVKRAVFLAEWAYYEGKLDYQNDFCKEIDRIVHFVNLFYDVNGYYSYKTGKQMALNEYFFRPYSGNNYMPYIYDFENYSLDDMRWESQFVSEVLKTHKG